MKHYLAAAILMAGTLTASTSLAMGERVPASQAGVTTNSTFMLSEAARSSSVGQAEMTHAQDTAHWGMLSLEMSKIARDKSTNPMVKQFAKFEVDEQETIADILSDIYPNMPKPALLEDEKLMLESLARTTGRNQDKMYVNLQIDGHEKLLAAQEAYLKSGTYLAQRNVARMAKGMIDQHLAVLRAGAAKQK